MKKSFKQIKILFVLLCIFVFPCLLLTGCSEKKTPGILFNNEPITRYNLKHASRTFEAGKRIYYLFYSPKKIKAEFIRVQIGKTGDNIPKGGYTVILSQDHRIMKQNMYYYYDNITLYRPGRYVMQIFDVQNLSEPLTWNYFYVY